MTTAQRWVGPFVALQIGQTIARFGGAFSNFALIWWVAQTYGTATSLATGVLISMVPGIVLGPLIGTIVDRFDRRFFIGMSNVVYATSAAALYVLAQYDLLVLWHLYVVMFINSLAGQFHYMSLIAATPMMVPNEHLQRVSGIGQLREGAVAVMAPPVGALLLEFIHLEGILLLEMVTGVTAALSIIWVAIPRPSADTTTHQPNVWGDLRAGFRYVRAWPGLMALLGVAMILNLLFNPAFSLMPLLVKDYLRGGAIQLAWMEAALGSGMIVGSVVLGVWGGFSKRMHTMLVGVLGMGIGAIVLGRIGHDGLFIGIGAMALFGFVQPLTNGPLMAIIQSKVAPEMQGRIMGFMGSLSGAISPIGLLLAGPIADRFGLQIWYLAAGVASLAVIPLMLGWATLRTIEEQIQPVTT
jgi:DHA3 family macrolide efflux protein-like MFS transporter